MADIKLKSGTETPSSVSTFIGSVDELSQQLEALGTPLAHELMHEIAAVKKQLQTWDDTPPPQDERVATIGRLLELNRRAMDYLSAERGQTLQPKAKSNQSGFLSKVIPRRWRR